MATQAELNAHESDTTSVHGIADTSTLYRSGGTDVAVADGGTGAGTAAGARTNLDVPSNAEAVLDSIVDAKGDLIVGTAADTVARRAVGSDGQVLTADAAESTGVKWATPASAGAANPGVCQGRLSLASGDPVPSADQADKSTVYFPPYLGNQIAIYNGSAWVIQTFSEISLALSGLTSGKNYDIFAYNNSGTLTLELGTAWTSDTARASGSGGLSLQDGIWVKGASGSADPTRRFLGTLRTTDTNKTQDTAAKRLLWNANHRRARALKRVETTSYWDYSGGFRQARADSANKVEAVFGLAEDAARLDLHVVIQDFTGGVAGKIAIGVDSTSVPHADSPIIWSNSTYSDDQPATISMTTIPSAGYHAFNWLEASFGGTARFYGEETTNRRSMLAGMVMA